MLVLAADVHGQLLVRACGLVSATPIPPEARKVTKMKRELDCLA